ncbi:endonuclease/exonuclease/phosphatase family protein [Acetobacter sp. DsW_059]|uniref:endonuclease/exonuclease/phosphatase family protein n=1 Tax=Acetobacter sp. DsW_059 TaxID=1670661 RepID=UPI001E598C6D|nr:endonuclease/exonuclease/phosphatase family protein [Acetobacter sp. DsW_059]
MPATPHLWRAFFMPARGRLCHAMALCLISPLLITRPCLAETQLKIATWNMDWLIDETSPQAQTAPPDIPHRTPDDFYALSDYAQHLNADIIAFQETDNKDTATRVFSELRYTILMTHDDILQRTGIALNKNLHITRHPDLTELSTAGVNTRHLLRSGLDITVQSDHSALRLLVIHLKAGCSYYPMTEKKHSCPTLIKQFSILQKWIAQRQASHEAFLILGDFNRRLTKADPLFLKLSQSGPLMLTTSGFATPCEGGRYFIDHLIAGGDAISWIAPGSLKVMLYKPDEQALTSDHCPVSVKLIIP